MQEHKSYQVVALALQKLLELQPQYLQPCQYYLIIPGYISRETVAFFQKLPQTATSLILYRVATWSVLYLKTSFPKPLFIKVIEIKEYGLLNVIEVPAIRSLVKWRLLYYCSSIASQQCHDGLVPLLSSPQQQHPATTLLSFELLPWLLKRPARLFMLVRVWECSLPRTFSQSCSVS